MLKRKDNKYFILLILITLFLFKEITFSSRTFFLRDTTFLFFPWKSFASESLQIGEIPLWNPYSYCGMPFLANMQSAIFYPLSIFFYIFNFTIALKFFIIIHTVIVGFFGYILLRFNRASPLASLICGFLFFLNGYYLSRLEFLSITGTMIWLVPLVLFLHSKNPLLFGITIAFSIFAGYPLILCLNLLLLILFMGEYNIRIFKILLFGFLIGIFLSLIQILPFYELFIHSVRKNMNYLDAIYYSLKPKNFIGITSPEFLKLTVFTGEKYLWVDSFWVGILPFLVGIFGLLSIKRKKIFYGFILIFIILSFGEYTEIYKYFYTYLPFLKITRHPSQFIYPIVIILVIVSSKGFDMILKRNKKKCFVIIFLSLIELLYYSYGVHPTAENVFFKEKGPVVKYFKELSKGEYFRFILTPKTDAERKIPYRDRIEQGWFIAKDKLYNLTSLPHHIFDAGGIGEPLEIREHRKIIESVGLQFDPDTANQFLNLINVKYLLSNYRINSKIYELIKETHIFIYKNKKYLPRVYYYSQKGNPQIANYKNNLVDIRLSDNQKQNEDKIILLDTYYPGWKVFIDGKRGNILKENDLFRMVNVKKNDKLVRFIYLPYTFLIGLIGSLISFLGILVYVKKTG